MKSRSIRIAALGLLVAVTSSAHEDAYTIDTSHSSVNFSIRHFVAKTTGTFKEFEGTIVYNADEVTKSSVAATIRVPSVDTASVKRDKHLNEEDYFHTEKFPLMRFKSTAWEATNKDNEFIVIGDLTMMGVTKPVTLEVELLGIGPGRNGAQLSGWEATTVIDRREWGLTSGAPAVGDSVEIAINIEAVKQ